MSLTAAADALGLDLPSLQRARSLSDEWITESRTFLLSELPRHAPLDVVFLGSIARREASPASDLDYLIIVHELLGDVTLAGRVVEVVDRLRDEKLGLEAPGLTGMFGGVVAAPDLVERIGLEQDTNLTHTRRILLMIESVSVLREDLWDRLLRGILQRYLADYEEPKRGVPRFLLNDVLRYWRTLTVDYQAKKWRSITPDWGLRYLKLIIPRKVALAGTLVSLFLCQEATEDYFLDQFRMSPLDRLSQLHTHLDEQGLIALSTALGVAEDFAIAVESDNFREAAKAVASRSGIESGSAFARLQDRARELQSSLETLFFTSPIAGASRKYLSF